MQLLPETRARRACPDIALAGKVRKPTQRFFGLKPGILLTQPNETRNEQRRAREQRDRERDLRADKNFAETLLPHTAARSAAAFLQSIDQIGARALQRRINSHDQSGQER